MEDGGGQGKMGNAEGSLLLTATLPTHKLSNKLSQQDKEARKMNES